MAVFKQLGGGNYTVEPFEVNYSHSFAWTSGSTSLSGSGFSINLANEPPTGYPVSTTQSLGGVTDGGFYSYPLFNSVKKYFYVGEASASANNVYGFYPSGSMFVWNVGSNYSGEGIKPDTFKIELGGSPSLNIQDDGTGKLKLNKTGSVVGNISYSHGVAAVQRNITASLNSFMSEDGISFFNTIVGAEYDDETTIDHTANTSVTAGMLVTGTGIPAGATVASVTDNDTFELSVATTGGSKTGQTLKLASIITTTFQSIVNIYEHTALCKVEPSEYNVTLNPTSFSTVDTLLSLTGASYEDDPTITHATNANVKVGMWVVGTGIPVGATVASVTSNTVFELSVATTGGSKTGQTLTLEGLGVGHYSNRIDSGSALPFITTIGLYNDFNELLVVGKLSKPITRMKYSDQTFVIKFDE